MPNRIMYYLFISMCYMLIGIIMENVINVTEPTIWAGVFFVYGVFTEAIRESLLD